MSSSLFARVSLSAHFESALKNGLTFTLLPGILVTWSPEDIGVGVKASLIQSYSILLSALLSINRNQLTTYDARRALDLTSPPLMVYLTIASIGDLCGVRTGLYKRVRSHRRILRVLGALILPLWSALSLTLWLSTRAFSNSKDDGGGSFEGWLYSLLFDYTIGQIMFNFVAWIHTPIMALFFFLCLFRRRSQVMKDFRARRGGASKLRKWRTPWVFVKCAWYISVVLGT